MTSCNENIRGVHQWKENKDSGLYSCVYCGIDDEEDDSMELDYSEDYKEDRD